MVEPPGRGSSGFWWPAVWVLWCVVAGALAGVGLIEFNRGSPPYDGGFLGDLALFGSLLAVGQAPFVALFVWALYGRAAGRGSWVGSAAAVLSALLWPAVGFVGWTAGSSFEVGFAAPLRSNASILAGVLPWLLVGTLEGVVPTAALTAVLASAGKRGITGSGETRATRNGGWGGLWGGTRTPAMSGLARVSASAIGGFLYEYWRSFDAAARQDQIEDAVGAYLEDAGVAENVAYEVVSNALARPILYGVPTGQVFVAVPTATLRRFAATG